MSPELLVQLIIKRKESGYSRTPKFYFAFQFQPPCGYLVV